MSPPKDGERGAGTARNGRGRAGSDDPGILSQLPRTRPQRSSRHRAAARSGSAIESPDTPIASAANGRAPAAPTPGRRAPAKAAPASRAKADRKPTKSRAGRAAGTGASGAKKATSRTPRAGSSARGARAATAMPTAPRQGFECEGERTSGTVHPPGGPELIASAAEIVGELAKAGLSTGDRLLKDVFSHLPL
jgi:diacylglycerol O-acyltransferase